MPKKTTKNHLKIDSVKHKDKRKNIPTEELRDFVKEDENKPAIVTFPGQLYARDSSLDPQLVWKGKDEQDRQPLTVPAVPIYIQEKIHPQAIIEDVRANAKAESEPDQVELFSDFNGIAFEKMIEFYRHENNWSNRMALGDSLMVMTSLAEKEGLKGKVQMIYFDPPYGIKFGSNWQVSTRKREVKDGKADDVVRQPEQIKAFRDTWKLGIHSYLSYMRDRLVAARELLTESGSIFVQIGDENVHLVRSLMDEVFGSENFVSLIVFVKTSGFEEIGLPSVSDYVLWYSKNRESVKTRSLQLPRSLKTVAEQYKFLEQQDGSIISLNREQILGRAEIPTGRRFMAADLTGQGETKDSFLIDFAGRKYEPTKGRHWSTNQQGIERLRRQNRLYSIGEQGRLAWKRYLDDFPFVKLTNQWNDTAQGGMAIDKIYVVQTLDLVIQRCMLMTTDPGDLVLDPTCGSGTTAYVAEQWGRRWITTDTSRVAIALARTRLMAGRFPYYLLSDTPEGKQKEAELTGIVPNFDIKTSGDIRHGFVCKRVPHVTLKSIANNEEIDTIHAKWQPQQDALKNKFNKLLKKSFKEWELPRQPEEKWPSEAKKILEEYWGLRKQRQLEIDVTISSHADREILCDQPFDDPKRIRVTGPFTVESLSPHRIISADADLPRSQSDNETGKGGGQFEKMILENLKIAGVKTTKKGEGIKFTRLDTFAGQWLHGDGEFADKDGKSKRVAVCIGPEHGTVGPQLIKEAAKEAVKGIGFDVLVVCGFAFDPHVAEEATRYGKLNVMIARMNPDLAMGEELLKKTGAGNLFMVFGEPDVNIKKTGGDITVELKGVDVYDPTTGQIRSNATDDIACWFVDTNYNGESFFVRHAYFCGGDEPFDKLKRALRAEINESAWRAIYSTTSRPFKKPESGKIAIKVINHYGDEVLKVQKIDK